MYDVVTFGEAMVRLSPPDFKRIEQASTFDVNIGGGEMNVAVGVSRLGLKAAFVTRLPQNALGRLIANKVRECGVDDSHIVWSKDGRAGLYFLEIGAKPRASSVLYDRAGSAISMIQPGEVNWEGIFQGTRLFHVSGITPALSRSCAEVTLEALKAAKAAGCSVTFDLNYRAKLWSQEEANRVMTPMMKYVDVLITTEEDTERVFGMKEDSYEKVAVRLQETFGFKAVTITLRETPSVWRNLWTAIAYADGKFYTDRTYEVEIVDRVGSGDSYSAGFIYGYLAGDIDMAVKYGNAFAALKHSVPGDLNWCTLDEVQAQVRGAGLRISR